VARKQAEEEHLAAAVKKDMSFKGVAPGQGRAMKPKAGMDLASRLEAMGNSSPALGQQSAAAKPKAGEDLASRLEAMGRSSPDLPRSRAQTEA
jgi:hypothetical protein